MLNVAWWPLWLLAFLCLWLPGAAHSASTGDASSLPSGVEVSADNAFPDIRVVQRLWQPNGTFGATWNSDGTRLAAYSEHGNLVTIWDTDGNVVQKLHRPGAVYAGNVLAFVAHDKQMITPPALYTSEDVTMSVFDISSGKVVHEVPGPYPDGPRRVNTADILAVSPDQSLAAIIYGPARDLPVALYSTSDWSRVAVLDDSAHGPLDKALSLAFSRDGQLLAVGRADGHVLFYDVATRRPLRAISAFGDAIYHILVNAVAFSPDGRTVSVGAGLVVMGWLYPNGRLAPKLVEQRVPDPVRVFDVRDGTQVASDAGRLEPIRSIAWHPSGRFVAFIAGDDTLRIWDRSNPGAREETVRLAGAAMSLAFSPDGSRLAVCAGSYLTIFHIAIENK